MSATQPGQKPGRAGANTPLEREISASFPLLKRRLHCMACRHVPPREADDVVATTLLLAILRERKGNHWDPAVESAEWRLMDIQYGVLRDWRRRLKRRPSSPLLETDDPASEEALPDEAMIARVEAEAREARAEEVRRRLTEQTLTGLSVRVLDATREGTLRGEALREAMKCSAEELKRARDRIRYQVDKVAAGAGEESEP